MFKIKVRYSPNLCVRLTDLFFIRRFASLLSIMAIFLTVASTDALALNPQKSIKQYLHEAWTPEQGLPQSSAHGVVQTADGYLWLATHNGLVRFDGLEFTVFNTENTPEMPDNVGHDLIAGRDGALWLGTNGGLTRIKDGVYTTYTTANGLSNNEVYNIYEEPDGSFWLRTTGGGINHFRDGKATFHKTQNGVSVERAFTAARDRNGTLWISAYPSALAAFNGDAAKTYGAKEGLDTDFVSAVYEDRGGNLWIGASGKLFKFDGERFVEYSIEDKASGAKAGMITIVREDRDGNFWLGAANGLFRFQASDGKVEAFTTKEGLTNDEIVSITEDREGNLWIGTHAGGLNRLRDAPLTAYTVADGLVNNDVNAFYQTRAGDIWFGTSGGASVLRRDGKFTNYTTKDGLPAAHVNSFYEDSAGRLWVGTHGGLCEFVNGKFKTDAEMIRQTGGLVFAVKEDRAGDLWVGSFRNGLTRFRQDGAAKSAQKFTSKEGLSDDRVSNIYEDRAGALWVGAYDGGLTRIRGEEFTVYRAADGLADDTVTAVYEDRDGTHWIGTSGGISRFRDGKFSNITMKNGLPANVIGGFAEDDAGNFWIASSKGIYRIGRQELNDFADGKIERVSPVVYDTADGLKTRETNAGGFRAADGRIWFLTVKGAAAVDPKNLQRNELPPPVHVEKIIADGNGIAKSERPELAPGAQNLEFHYAGLSFAAPTDVKYRYRLEGYDKDWVDADNRRVAYYTNLAPGDYNFRVVAANNDGVWNEAGASQQFRLRPFFYQTSWFLGFAALGLVVVGVGANGWRVRRLKTQQKRLTSMVEERTHELTEAYRKIESDNERKTKELEEARVMQLSMLPKKLPAVPNLEIAAYMKPATEVGGDYYDFHVGADGTLTVAVGDATGHGLKAGTMVSVTKGLFNNLAAAPDIPDTFRQISRSLKAMNLRGLFMAMTMLKFKDDRVILCSAGMPSILISRHGTKQVEEISIKAMPLGSITSFAYQQQEILLSKGDAIIVMSDGFPEMFSEAGEMLGYDKAEIALRENADRSAQEIINHFVSTAESWAGARPSDDDVTFVVIKMI